MQPSFVLPLVKCQINSIKMGRTFTTFVKHIDNKNKFNRLYCTRRNIESSSVKELLDNATVLENKKDMTTEWSTTPYINPRLQSNHALRPRVDPRETSIILFPGEGCQYVGMGKNLLKFPGVRDIFGVANEILKYDLLSLCLKGPKSKLDETKYSQVAVMVCSLAALERLKEERPTSVDNCIATAGFSVGELTALTFAGVFTFERAVRLAQLRGEAMQVASQMESSGLMTVLYKASTKLHEVLVKAKEYANAEGVEKPVCEVANYLFPHCKVLGGHNQCLRFIEKNFKELKLERVRRLNVSGAYHTSLMEPASSTFKKYLMKSKLEEPVIAVHSGVDSKCYNNAEDIVRNLSKSIMRPVRWEQLMHVLYERPMGEYFPSTFECGPGNTLKTIMKMVNAKAYDVCETIFD